jgi:hypothetical protein
MTVDANLDAIGTRRGPGNIVIGVTLILTGLAMVLDRAGLFSWRDQWTLWPLILGGIGLARFLQSPPGEPKQGLLFLLAAAWLIVVEAGAVSLEESWPIAVIAFGLLVALNGGRRRRWYPPVPPVPPIPPVPGEDPARPRHRHRHRRRVGSLSPLAVLGAWIAIVIALQMSGIRGFNQAQSSEDRLRLVSVMSRGEHVGRPTVFRGADVTNVMGRSELDLTQATLAPGASTDVRVFSMMGSVVLRVPSTWTVDAGAVTAFGGVRDNRSPAAESEAPDGTAPRLVLRGLVMFGRLTITS